MDIARDRLLDCSFGSADKLELILRGFIGVNEQAVVAKLKRFWLGYRDLIRGT